MQRTFMKFSSFGADMLIVMTNALRNASLREGGAPKGRRDDSLPFLYFRLSPPPLRETTSPGGAFLCHPAQPPKSPLYNAPYLVYTVIM